MKRWGWRVGALLAGAGTGTAYYFVSQRQTSNNGLPWRFTSAALSQRLQRNPNLQRFLEYATVEQDGEAYLTAEDFLAAIGVEGAPNLQRNRDLFLIADKDRNGLISFSEFCAFQELLSTRESEFKLAFELFDLDRSGTIGVEEFEKVIATHCATDADAETLKALAAKFYNGSKKELHYEEFVEFLHSLKNSLLEAHFLKVSTNGKTLSKNQVLEAFRRSSASKKVLGLVVYAQNDLPAEIDFTDFLAMHQFGRDLEKVTNILELYTAAGGSVDKATFYRALRQQTQGACSEDEVRMIFRIFGKEGSDELDFLSFEELVEATSDKFVPRSLTILETITLGGLSAMVGATVVFPIDKVKTLVQSSKQASSQNAIRAMQTQFKTILKAEGLRGLYRGLLPQLIGITPEKALKITVNDRLRKAIRGNEQRDLKTWEEMLAGCGTGMFQVFVTNPIELLKIRIQIQALTGERKPLPQVIRETGLRGLYTGLPATLLRDIPFNIIYFSTYAGVKKSLRRADGSLSPASVFAAGAVAGLMAAALDTPADTIKTRLQNGQGQYKGVIDCARSIYKNEGPMMFFKGVLPRCMIIAPLFSITFFLFEFFQKTLLPNKYSTNELLGEHINRTAVSFESTFGIKL